MFRLMFFLYCNLNSQFKILSAVNLKKNMRITYRIQKSFCYMYIRNIYCRLIFFFKKKKLSIRFLYFITFMF